MIPVLHRLRHSERYALVALLVGIPLVWLLNVTLGHWIIARVYAGQAGPLSGIIHGHDHPVAHFYAVGDRMVGVVLTIVAVIAAVVLVRRPVMKRPEVAALLLGVAIVLVLTLALEGAVRLLHVGAYPNVVHYPDNYYRSDENGIHEGVPGVHRVVGEVARTGENYFDVTCTIDEFGRRVVPLADAEGRDRYILFFGGSLIYGEGVEDDESLPARVGALARDYRPYNYGFHGLGPYDVMAKIETIDFAKEVAEPEGMVVYLFIDHHVLRTEFIMSSARYRRHKQCYLPDASGTLVRAGTWQDAMPRRVALYSFLAHSQLLRALHVDFPMKITPAHVDKAADAIVRMAALAAQKFPQSEFCVVFYPQSQFAPQVAKRLDENGIRYLIYPDLLERRAPEWTLSPVDDHPNARAYQKLAAAIVSDLGLE